MIHHPDAKSDNFPWPYIVFVHGRNLVGDGGGGHAPPHTFSTRGDIPYFIPPPHILTNNENYML